MFQIRGLSDADPWAEAGSGEVVDMNPPIHESIGSKIKDFFTSTSSGAIVATSQPTPTTQATMVIPVVKPWYKTPIGIVAILGGAFVGWKYVLPKLRKKSS